MTDVALGGNWAILQLAMVPTAHSPEILGFMASNCISIELGFKQKYTSAL